MAIMGIRGFGVQKGRPRLDEDRFDKNRRTNPAVRYFSYSIDLHNTRFRYRLSSLSSPPMAARARYRPSAPPPTTSVLQQPSELEDDEDEGSSSSHSSPLHGVYDPDAPELAPRPAEQMGYDLEDAVPQFPITHELTLSDHTKVISSALAMDPSGARILSGSHDYECKLWDFGGMDSRAKPFKSWEPSGSYYVSEQGPQWPEFTSIIRSMTSVFEQG